MRVYINALLGIVMSVAMVVSGNGLTAFAASPQGAESSIPNAPSGVEYMYKTYFSKDITATTNKVDAVLSKIASESQDDTYIVNAVTDWMRSNLTYDYNNYINGYENDRDASVIAAMEDGIANDEGYAAIFDMFMYRAGIPSARVIGVADGYKHTWNMVYLEDNWYFIDVAWMDAGRPYNYVVYDLPTDISGPEYAELRQRLAETENSYSMDAATEYNLTDVSVGWRDHQAVYCEVTKVVDTISELNGLN